MTAVPGRFLRGAQNTAQDIHFITLQPRPPEQAAQLGQQPSGLVRIVEARVLHDLRQVRVKTLDFSMTRWVAAQRRHTCIRQGRRTGKGRHAALIAQKLHCRAQIERAELRISGNGHRRLALHDFLVRQTAAFVTEYQRHRAVCRTRQQFRDYRTWRPEARPKVTLTGAQRNRKYAGLQCFRQAIDLLRPFQDIHCPRRPRCCFRIRKLARRHQAEVMQAHGFHCPRRSTNIAWMAGAA